MHRRYAREGRATSSIIWGEFTPTLVRTTVRGMSDRFTRIDGALEPWTTKLSETLLHIFPSHSSSDSFGVVEGPPPPRVTIVDTKRSEPNVPTNVLLQDGRYHLATLTRNDRLTADDWYQDVRHIEFDFDDDIQ